MEDSGDQKNVSPAAQEAIELGAGGVPKGAKTSDYYHIGNIPARFDNPDWFQGYNIKPVSALYRTSNADYGARPPSVHTLPTKYFPKTQEFSEKLQCCGMYRNHSLNCGMDKSAVPDH